MASDREDGIYFAMPEQEYHALPRLSASGIKSLLVSIPTFWAKSWMSPDDPEDEQEDTKAQILGRAYHTAIFEPERLAERFVGEPEIPANALMTDTDVKAALADMGETQAKKGELALDRAHRLASLGYANPIKSIILDEFEQNLGGRQVISRKYWTQIHRDLERIQANPEIHQLVTGGASEVTILWTCPDSGIAMKARIDKLKADCFVDLKSFSNKNGKPVNQAVADQVQYYRYYLQMRLYQIAIGMIRVQDLPICDDDPTADQVALVAALRAKKTPLQPWLFFQEKGGIPNLLARRLMLQQAADGAEAMEINSRLDPKSPDYDAEADAARLFNGILCRKADLEIAYAKRQFSMAMEIYGLDSEWYPLDMIGRIEDGDFRDWFLEQTPGY